MARARSRIPTLSAVVAAAFCLLSAAPAMAAEAADQAPGDVELAAALDAIFTKAYQPDGSAGPAPGAAVLVQRDGKALLRKGYGSADLELGVAIEPDMIFRLGSITKQFTAAAIMMLVESGDLSLDQTVAELLPDYPDVHDAKVTVEHLLTHTSGIPSYTGMEEFWHNVRKDHQHGEMLAYWHEAELEFEPGSRWSYNNSGYYLLGVILEQVSGKSYAEFLHQRIFKPLGMSATVYGDPETLVPRRVEGYQAAEDGFKNAPFMSMTAPYAAGSLLSTVDDLARWNAALDGERLLREASLERMWTPYTLADGSSTGYGYGWAIGEYRGLRVIQHGGGIHGFSTHALRIPAKGVYVAVLSNGHPASTSNLASEAASLAAGEPLRRTAIELAPEVLERYAGVYRIDQDTTRVVSVEHGKLYTQRTGSRKLQAFPASETDFFYLESMSEFRFEIEQGQVTAMVMTPWGAAPERAAMTAEPLPEGPAVAAVDPALYDRLEGRYELLPGFVLTIRREQDRLISEATNQGPIEIFPSSATEFFNTAIGARLIFHLDGDRATGLTLEQGSQKLEAKRLDD